MCGCCAATRRRQGLTSDSGRAAWRSTRRASRRLRAASRAWIPAVAPHSESRVNLHQCFGRVPASMPFVGCDPQPYSGSSPFLIAAKQPRRHRRARDVHFRTCRVAIAGVGPVASALHITACPVLDAAHAICGSPCPAASPRCRVRRPGCRPPRRSPSAWTDRRSRAPMASPADKCQQNVHGLFPGLRHVHGNAGEHDDRCAEEPSAACRDLLIGKVERPRRNHHPGAQDHKTPVLPSFGFHKRLPYTLVRLTKPLQGRLALCASSARPRCRRGASSCSTAAGRLKRTSS